MDIIQNNSIPPDLAFDLHQVARREPSQNSKLDRVSANGGSFISTQSPIGGDVYSANTFNYNITVVDLMLLGPHNDSQPPYSIVPLLKASTRRHHSGANESPYPASEDRLTETSSRHLQPAAGNRQIESVRQERLNAMMQKSTDITDTYDQLLDECDSVKAKFEYVPISLETIEKDLDAQKLRFEISYASLVKRVKAAPVEQVEHSILLHAKVVRKLETISSVLKDVPMYYQDIFKGFKGKDDTNLDDQVEARAARPDALARDILVNVDRKLDDLDTLAQEIFGESTKGPCGFKPTHSPDEFKRFSLDSLASATLFQCFCSACPVQEHRSHFAYLSLTSGSRTGPETRMAILPRAKHRKDPVWLRVVSVASSNPIDSSAETTERVTTRKRRRLSDATMPPSKVPKARVGDVPHVVDAWQYHMKQPIQVCLEYLAQHEEPELLVMQMVDTSNAFHKIYFLPQDERPPQPCEPVTLYKMLLGRPSSQTVLGDAESWTLWKLRVARLIAEAALRFDWPEAPCHWGGHDVIFFTSESSSNVSGPFLKVEINSQSRGAKSSGPISRGQKRTVLNLAFILLQIGCFKPIESPPESYTDEQYRQYIITQGENVDVPGDFLAVVRRCAEISDRVSSLEEPGVTKDLFRQEYYEDIISPLKEMEAQLISLRRKGI